VEFVRILYRLCADCTQILSSPSCLCGVHTDYQGDSKVLMKGIIKVLMAMKRKVMMVICNSSTILVH